MILGEQCSKNFQYYTINVYPNEMRLHLVLDMVLITKCINDHFFVSLY